MKASSRKQPSTWQAVVKRSMDVAASALGLLVLMPVFVAVAIAIRCDSGGPVFFLQQRVGRGGRPFWLIKFRTMVRNASSLGGPLTASHEDPRITRVGRLLRKTKLDELPQLINVLRGEMSLVGPRPEVPKYVELFPAEYEYLLTIRPGITDPASLEYRDEAAVLGSRGDPEREYIDRILPDKIALSRQYVASMSPWLDLQLIVRTLLRIAAPENATSKRLPATESDLPDAGREARSKHMTRSVEETTA